MIMWIALPPEGSKARQLDVGTLGNGLPDLPPEWGKVEIPDDAAELDAEAEIIRKDLRREAKIARKRATRGRWRRRFGLPPRIDDPDEPSLLLPLLVLGVALLVTLLSLLLIAWPSLSRPNPNRIDPGPSVVRTS